MEFRSVEIEHSNPSMGPHEVTTSYTLSLEDHRQDFDEFLRSITVNGRVSLGEYLRLLAEGPAAEAEAVRRAFEPEDLASGATISDLKFHSTEGKTLTLSDLRYFRLAGFYGSPFLKLLVEKGHKYQSRAGGFASPKEESAELRPLRSEPLRSRERTPLDDDDEALPPRKPL